MDVCLGWWKGTLMDVDNELYVRHYMHVDVMLCCIARFFVFVVWLVWVIINIIIIIYIDITIKN